jgi:tetratricopeptide (TPR) repeat protein
MPPAREESIAPPPSSPAVAPPKPRSRLGRVAFAIAAFGFGTGFFLTGPSAPSIAEESHGAPVDEVVEAPRVSIASIASIAPAAAVAAAPARVVTVETPAPSVAFKALPTVADGDAMLRAGNAARAEEIYQSVLAHGGSDHEALTGLGKVALESGHDNDAIAFFERALARQPQYFPARLGIADALWSAGRTDAAKAHYAALHESYADRMIPARVVERTR